MANALTPWGPEKKKQWLSNQSVKRLYEEDVFARIEALRTADRPEVQIEQYGKLSFNPDRFPLFAFKIGDFSQGKRSVLITGGVHGYETSGVKGALLFIEEHAQDYLDQFNFVVAPCISPWSYETINRLDPIMENPNREFTPEGKAEESRLVMNYVESLNIDFAAHIDLHETTDSDKIFLPEEYSKNGLSLTADQIDIPDGFYLIGLEGHVRPDLENAMIESVRKVSHIAKPDSENKILEIPLTSEGVIHKTFRGLCSEFTNARNNLGAYTTEMYPDSPKFKAMSTDEIEDVCNRVQVACLRGALDYWVNSN